MEQNSKEKEREAVSSVKFSVACQKMLPGRGTCPDVVEASPTECNQPGKGG